LHEGWPFLWAEWMRWAFSRRRTFIRSACPRARQRASDASGLPVSSRTRHTTPVWRSRSNPCPVWMKTTLIKRSVRSTFSTTETVETSGRGCYMTAGGGEWSRPFHLHRSGRPCARSTTRSGRSGSNSDANRNFVCHRLPDSTVAAQCGIFD